MRVIAVRYVLFLRLYLLFEIVLTSAQVTMCLLNSQLVTSEVCDSDYCHAWTVMSVGTDLVYGPYN